MTVIAVPKYAKLGQGFSRQELLQAAEAPGRPIYRLAGGWIADMVALKKFIMLCEFCQPKFNPRKHGYEVYREETHSVGQCDGCNQMSTHLRGYISQSLHSTLGEERVKHRGRWIRRAV